MGIPKDEFIRLRVAGWEKHWISHKAEKAHIKSWSAPSLFLMLCSLRPGAAAHIERVAI